jgi:hypothetical protein
MADPTPRLAERVFRALGPAEQDLLLDLARSSGSLKALAKRHGVSYPTIRARLDRLIERLEALEAGDEPDPMALELASLVEQGQLTAQAARQLLHQHRQLLAQTRRDP